MEQGIRRMNDAITGSEIVIDGGTVRQSEPADRTLGAPLAKVKALIDDRRHRYDWRRCEAKLNDWCQYKTSIDGLGIHFLHVRSKHENALPLFITHGSPGSGFSRALIGAVKVKRKEESHD
jgi:hypothetical protein